MVTTTYNIKNRIMYIMENNLYLFKSNYLMMQNELF